MKIRTDFVTNSSSSCFILARKSELSDRQKEAIVKFVEDELLGTKILSPESTEEEIQNELEEDDGMYRAEYKEEIRKALAEGKTIYRGLIQYDDCEYSLGNIYEKLWTILEETGDGDFVAIDSDLSY